MKIIFSRLQEFNQVAGQWMLKNPDDSKIGYAIKKIAKQLSKIMQDEDTNLSVINEDLRIDSFTVDDKGQVLKHKETGREHQTPEALKKLNHAKIEARKKFNEELQLKEFEITPHIVEISRFPDLVLTEEEKQAFAGIII